MTIAIDETSAIFVRIKRVVIGGESSICCRRPSVIRLHQSRSWKPSLKARDYSIACGKACVRAITAGAQRKQCGMDPQIYSVSRKAASFDDVG
jgi:hypothetical protein